jgi:hypothetical protein
MVLANCSQCGILYNRTTSDLCLSCFKEEEELFQETQNFIRKNPHTSMAEVLEHVEVEQAMLDKWIAEKRIQFYKSESIEAKSICMYCGRPVRKEEKICRTCLYKQAASRMSAESPTPAKERGEFSNRGMHVKHYLE